MLIFWKVLAISKWFKDIFANLYVFYLKIAKSCRCKNLDIFPLKVSLVRITCWYSEIYPTSFLGTEEKANNWFFSAVHGV